MLPPFVKVRVKDFLSSGTHKIIFADNVSPQLILNRSPLINSWRPGRFELRNMCELFECGFLIQDMNLLRESFYTTGCKLFRNKPCQMPMEYESVIEMEEIFLRSTLIGYVELGNRKFGFVGNADDNSVIMELNVQVSTK
jgi:hypothetical protein